MSTPQPDNDHHHLSGGLVIHKLLQRQLEKNLPEGVKPNLERLVAAVSWAYDHNDQDRTRLERSLELSSKELGAINQRLRQEGDEQRAILASMSEGLIVVNDKRLITLINPAAERLLEVRAPAALGQMPGQFITLKQRGRMMPTEDRPIYLTLKFQRPTRIDLEDEVVLQTNSGRQFPAAFSTAPLIAGDRSVGAVILFRDISSEAKVRTGFQKQVAKTQTEAKERRAELMASVRNLDIGFILTDGSLSITLINQAAMRIVGVDLTDATNLNKLQQTLGDEFDLIKACRRCLQTGRSTTKRSVPFGEKYLHFYLSPITLDDSGPSSRSAPAGVAILAEDTTEARLLERSKDEFFSIASHELRTPLSAIRGNTAMIKQFGDRLDKKGLLEMVDDIHQSSVRMIELVSDFLDLSRLHLGKIRFLKKTFTVEALIEEVIKELVGSAEASQTKLQLQRSKTALPMVSADPDRVKQVLINLVGNAIKFTDKGSVTVRVAREGDHFVKVFVTDTGRGLSQESQRLLFHKFQQTGESLLTRDTTRGTGLGLYISRLLVKGMGGEIGLFSSQIGKGSIFAFTLPIAKSG